MLKKDQATLYTFTFSNKKDPDKFTFQYLLFTDGLTALLCGRCSLSVCNMLGENLLFLDSNQNFVSHILMRYRDYCKIPSSISSMGLTQLH